MWPPAFLPPRRGGRAKIKWLALAVIACLVFGPDRFCRSSFRERCEMQMQPSNQIVTANNPIGVSFTCSQDCVHFVEKDGETSQL